MFNAFITVAGTNFRFGTDGFRRGMKVRLIKEPENEYDREAIRVEAKGLGKIGYVANSIKTVKGESMSAGRLYDHIGETASAKVMYVMPDFLICRVSKKSLIPGFPFWKQENDFDEEPEISAEEDLSF